MNVSFIVEGEPIPKGRPRFNRYTGTAHTPPRTKAYEEQVAWKATAAMRGRPPTTQPVHVDVRIFFAIPKNARNDEKIAAHEERLWHCKKCDSDNVFKSITDGAIGIVYKDDSQVCEMTCSKKYSDNPRVEVDVWELKGASR
jgi:Holliday junction resolvase RusA-like endonuclease